MRSIIGFFMGMLMVSIMFTFSQCTHKAIPSASKPVLSDKPVAKSTVKSSATSKGENFDKFYERFHKDSVFQLNRVKFPLQGKQVNAAGTNSWKKDNWTMIKAKASEINTSEYNVKTSKTDNTYFEGIYCKNCGFSFEMKFQLINHKWYLVYLVDNDL
jgi:hypothetical protein